MPLVGFRPTKARLIIDDSNDTVLVMKVVVADSESVELASGGKLDALTGVLRIRERKEGEGRNGAVGSLVYIEETGEGPARVPAKYQINITMAPDKFKALLRVAVNGLLPNKFFVDAGERVSARETRGLSYGLRSDARTKIWDTASFPSIRPCDVPSNGTSRMATLAIDIHGAETKSRDRGGAAARDCSPGSRAESGLARATRPSHCDFRVRWLGSGLWRHRKRGGSSGQ